MEFIELKTNVRTSVGKGPAKALRRENHLPAVLYGPGTDPVLLSVNINDLDDVLKKTSAGQVLLNLVVQNGETYTKTAMVKELQIHPVTRNYIHIDFYEISMDRKIKVKVPIVVQGKSKGVELGGMLQIIRRELEVFCLPSEIPGAFEIDITDLDIGDSIHIRDISLEGDFEFPDDGNLTIVTILSQMVQEEPEEEEEEEAEAAALGEASAEADGEE